ncbi:UDP-3-O-(3-hydroxymyristoyl)glucosamine N-acyltransferase [Paracrocinitomix mangrovi]|uniref:UDP-3-O-(3-hydroxymyristoyl)glucosamine N-acyltransferase n=1 Tax=Paracrocinitomix mangrovi TaxID=2862509 RepID=UPI001C8E9CA0|nr:UDP-3-O-(3-hydroxymyristoyl)glucosamine N-acyltransferase [Paracrocinitomix mangrovi]UKN03014.1 UDP-3-O-(3-hydroxymyristoyl)glucosamine N-acyltransferase [Paracrocinitomix mangrovi]
MKFKKPLTVKEMANFLGCPFHGDANLKITGINEIHKVESGDIVFVDHPKYYNKALKSAADIILIDQQVDVPKGKAIIVSAHPFDDFNKITKHYSPFKSWENQHGDNFEIGEDSILHPNVVIGHNVKIGNRCVLHAGVVIGDGTEIGDDVVIGANSVIGHDAFYYKKKADGYDRMHSCGRVVLKDKVEIGALSTIDRGVTGDTVIGVGTKIDNQVHIGHDTVIGDHCLLAANVGVAGCVVLEDHVILWGQVGIASDVVIGSGAVIQAQSGVGRSLVGGKTYFGSPASDARTALKELAALRRLPSIIENI